jgi:hypothetical protein
MHGLAMLLRGVVCGMLTAGAPANAVAVPGPSSPASQVPQTGALSVTAALVDRDMLVRSVPLHPLALLGAANDTILLRTSIEGKATLFLPPGNYTLNSVAPASLEGRSFRWSLPLTIKAGATLDLTLSNDNAVAERVTLARGVPPASSGRAGPVHVSRGALAEPARMRVGLGGGLNQSRVSWAGQGLSAPSYRSAWSAGVTLDLPLTQKFSLATGLRYVEYGSLVEFGPIPVTTAYQPNGTSEVFHFGLYQGWRYLAIPVQLRVRPLPARDVFLGFGPEVGYLLAVWGHRGGMESDGSRALDQVEAAVAWPAATIFEKVGTMDFSTDVHNYSRWNLALGGSVGCEFPFDSHVGVVEVRYAHGLVNVAKTDWVKRSTRGFELLIGARW